MEQLKLFFLGVAKMIAIIALLITCIGAFTTKDGFFIAMAIISLVTIGYKVYELFRDTRNN